MEQIKLYKPTLFQLFENKCALIDPLQAIMKRARNDLVNGFLDLEAAVGDDNEEDNHDEEDEDSDGASAGVS